MKTVYLICKQYKKMAFSELSLAFLIVILCLTFTYTMCFTFESGAKERYVKETFDEDTIILELDSKFSDELDEHDAMQMQDIYSRERWKQAYDDISDICDAKGISRISQLPIAIDGWKENPFRNSLPAPMCYEYNNSRNLIAYDNQTLNALPMKLSEGRWFYPEEAKGIAYTKEALIPVILSKDWDNCYEIGDVITGKLDGFDLDLQSSVPSGTPTEKMNFVVIGKLSNDAYIYMMCKSDPPFEGMFMRASDSSQRTTAFMISPEIYVDGALMPTQNWSAFRHDSVFIYKGNISTDVISNKLTKYGKVSTPLEYAQRDTESFSKGSNEYTIHLIVSSLMLIISLIGYNLLLIIRTKRTLAIYYSVGMKKTTGIFITLAGNFLTFIAAGIIGIICGLLLAANTRAFASDTVLYTILLTVGVLITLYFLSAFLSAAMLMRLDPCKLLEEE